MEVRYYINDMSKQIALLVLASRGRPSLKFEDLLDLYVAITPLIAELENRGARCSWTRTADG